MAAKSRTKRKTSTSAAKPEEQPWQPTVKPTAAARKLMERRDRAKAILDRLDDKCCTELGRRARGAPRDGYPSSTRGEGVSNSEVSRPTEATALVAIESTIADPVGDAIAEVFATMGEIASLAKILDDQRGYIMATGNDRRGRISALGSCAACTRDVACTPTDRLVAGYCSACYKAWARAGRPERREFELDRYNAALAIDAPRD